MSKTNEMMSYIKQFIHLAKGEDAEALAIKVQRSAKSALQTRLHNEEGNLYELEEKVEKAKENLTKARMNNLVAIEDRSSYVSNLISARNSLTQAEEALENKKLLLTVLKEELDILNK